MRNLILAVTLLVSACFASHPAYAGNQYFDDTTNLGVFNKVKCTKAGGLSCTKAGDVLQLSLRRSATTTAERTRYGAWIPGAVTQATSATPSATSLYLTQIRLPAATTLTGIKVLNAATVGTNKYIVALFNSSGAVLANSALAGVTTSGASVYQAVPFTASYTVTTPGTYWIGLYVNGTTDRYYAIPFVGEGHGLAGAVTGQTFGTVAAVTLPTTFTADVGPVAFTY